MAWAATSAYHFQRRAGENELMIKLMGDTGKALGREHWSVTSQASFKLLGSLQEADIATILREAWMAFRFQHPGIATVFNGELLEYVVPDRPALEKWAGETFVLVKDDGKTTAGDVIARLSPTPQATLHYLEGHDTVILHTAHWRTDGYGALQLLNDFLQLAAIGDGTKDPGNLAWGDEVSRLPVSVEEALLVPPSPAPAAVVAEAARCFATTALAVGAVGLSYLGDAATKARGTRGETIRLSRTETEAIIFGCKAQGLGFEAALHASIAVVAFEAASSGDNQVGGETDCRRYTSTIRRSLREAVSEVSGTPASYAALYTSGWFVAVEEGRPWGEYAALFEKEYASSLSREFLLARRAYANLVLERLRNPPQPSSTTSAAAQSGGLPSGIDISSVGDATVLVDPIHQDPGPEPEKQGYEDDIANTRGLEVLRVSVGVETLTRHTYCFVWMFRGQLQLNLVYNEAFYESHTIQGLLTQIKQVLIDQFSQKME
ncbi:uncharacterized protein TrAtP1_008986 [Trichoderma atroviride]|uniref:Condensation domain-containing protein n=1 Tax=Hypocrea atroviridis (strain ATCC 20476 / IMI 206040) TaxID=452589 RepID=G9NYC7_HYPAI|nr:uncharacterized protein TRIATDRAFT_87481 [Trichoderma atroviride IMI 206040]EHK44441.1 hypothetical protein TRIATDRAFT_87481 [Trichoderma atroviride IMI 206040]UKZ67827.1 hypothetical protein TrAtP1_008986 [Trichoderma atroviride]